MSALSSSERGPLIKFSNFFLFVKRRAKEEEKSCLFFETFPDFNFYLLNTRTLCVCGLKKKNYSASEMKAKKSFVRLDFYSIFCKSRTNISLVFLPKNKPHGFLSLRSRPNMKIMLGLITAAFASALLAQLVTADCTIIYTGLCPGDDSCVCSLGESCGNGDDTPCVGNRTRATNKDGGCSGNCVKVEHNRCPGGDNCLFSTGTCSPPPPRPPANFSVILPSSGDGTGGSNFSFTIIPKYGTTGRLATVRNPKNHWSVYCAGCEGAGSCTGVTQTVDIQARSHNCTYATNPLV